MESLLVECLDVLACIEVAEKKNRNNEIWLLMWAKYSHCGDCSFQYIKEEVL